MHIINWNPRHKWSIDGYVTSCFILKALEPNSDNWLKFAELAFLLNFWIFLLKLNKTYVGNTLNQINNETREKRSRTTATRQKKTNECENQHKLGRTIHPTLFESWMKSFEFLDKIHEPSLLRLYALSDLFGLRVFHWNCLFFTSIAYLTFFSIFIQTFCRIWRIFLMWKVCTSKSWTFFVCTSFIGDWTS